MKLRQLTVVLSAVLVTAGAASAYVLNGPRWGDQQVPYYINPVNSDLSEADTIAAIQAGAMAWASQSNADVLPYYMGRTTGSSLSRNNKNEVFFRDASAGSMAAETYWWYDSSYRLVEADILFYDGGFKFFAGVSGCSGGVYLEDITAHEFGHALGLGHSGVATASMYPSMSWCSTAVRTLDPDDLAGIEALYPAGGTNTAPTLTITSPSNGASVVEGVSITFSGSAMDEEDGNVGSSMVWTSNLDGQIGTGSDFGRVLSVGSHTITARVTDSRGATAEAQRSVKVETPIAPTTETSFALRAQAYKVKGVQTVDLFWSGASSATLDVFRNGARVAVTSNTGRFTDRTNRKGAGAYTYVLCEAGTSVCSNQVTVGF